VRSRAAAGEGLTADLKAYAGEIGFHLIGITSPEPFPQAELDIIRWLNQGHQGEMGWLNEARARLATRPQELLPGARSLIVVGVSYRTVEPDSDEASTQSSVRSPESSPGSGSGPGPQPWPGPGCSPASPPGGRVARYAWGSDYHGVLKSRLGLLAKFLSDHVSCEVRSRIFVDSGPLVERDAAMRAGLGFRGKNTNLLTSIGSYVFLGALLTDVELDFDRPLQKDCGSCRLCIDACPTDALDQAYHLAAERCIAYLTIEHRGPIDAELRPKLGDWVFGCDICQEVCPHNTSRRGRPRGWSEFEPREATRLDLGHVLALDDDGFRQAFRGSPIKRAKRHGLARNAALALGNQGDATARPGLERAAAEDPAGLVREAAEWALRRLPSSAPPVPAAERAAGEPQ
jgi:epoxyqueuosine reductase